MPISNNAMAAIAAALGLAKRLNDPNAGQRKRLMDLLQTNPDLIQQYKDQGNPQIASTLAGMKPRFGLGMHNGYDDLTSLISNTPASAETVRRQKLRDLVNKPDSNTTTQLSSLPGLDLGGSLGGSNIPGASITEPSEDTQSKREFLYEGKIKSPEERQKEKLGLAEQVARTKEQDVRTALAQQDLEYKNQQRTAVLGALPKAQAAIAKLPKGQNLYAAIMGRNPNGTPNGSLDPESVQALNLMVKEIPQSEGIYSRIQNERMLYEGDQREHSARVGRNQTILNQTAARLVEESQHTPTPLSMDQAIQITQDPSQIQGNPTLKAAWENVLTYNRRNLLSLAHNDFAKETAPIRTKILQQGGQARSEDLEAMNNASASAYAPLGLEPVQYDIRSIPKSGPMADRLRKLHGNWLGRENVLTIVGGDKELRKALTKTGGMPDLTPDDTSSELSPEQTSNVDQAVKTFKTEQEYIADMTKGGVDSTTLTKLAAAYRNRKTKGKK